MMLTFQRMNEDKALYHVPATDELVFMNGKAGRSGANTGVLSLLDAKTCNSNMIFGHRNSGIFFVFLGFEIAPTDCLCLNELSN